MAKDETPCIPNHWPSACCPMGTAQSPKSRFTWGIPTTVPFHGPLKGGLGSRRMTTRKIRTEEQSGLCFIAPVLYGRR